MSGDATGEAAAIAVENAQEQQETREEMPPVFNWQYQRRARQLPIGAQSKVDLPIVVETTGE